VGAIATRTASLADRAALSAKGAASALGRMGAGIATLARSLGPLDIAILGFLVVEGLKAAGDKVIADQEQVLKAIEAVPHTQAAVERQQAAIASALKRPGAPHTVTAGLEPLGLIAQGHVKEGLSQALRLPGAGFSDTLSGRIFNDDYEAPWTREDRIKHEAEMAKGENDRIKRLQDQQRKQGKPVPLQTLDQVRANMEADAKLREQNVISLAEFDRRMKKNITEMKTARNQTEGDRRATEQEAARLKREAAPDLYHRYQGAPVEEVRLRMQNLAAVISQGDATSAQLREYGYAYRQIVERIGNSSDPKNVQAFLADREAYFKGLEDMANADLQNALLIAPTEAARQAAFRRTGRTLRREIPKADREQLRKDSSRLVDTGQDITSNRAKHGVGQASREFLQNLIDKGGGAIPGVTAARDKIIEYEKKLDADLKKDQGDLAKYQKAIRNDKKRIRDAVKRADRANKANAEAAFQDRQQGRDIQLALEQSRTDDPVAQAHMAQRKAEQGLADARKHGNSRDISQAEAKANAAEFATADAVLQRMQALSSVREAKVAIATGGDPVAMAQAAQVSATQEYNYVKAHSHDAGKIAAAYGKMLQASFATAQAAKDQATQLAGIQADITAARAGGGALASAQAAQTKAANATAHAKTKVERAQALLDTINANNQMEQALADQEASRFELLASATDDPVKKAQYQLKGDRALLKHAHGRAEHNRAQARVNDDLRAVRDQKLQGKEDDIDFNLEMERINRQTAIEQYQSLLRMHNLTKAQRRDILRKIHSLQKEGESEASGFGLQVQGGVKLPTIYDVRRAISGVQRAMSHNLTYQAKAHSDAINGARDAITNARGGPGGGVNANTRIVVNVEVTDPNSAGKVFDQIDKALSTGVRSSVRSAGLSL
jgi:hypothetical protein